MATRILEDCVRCGACEDECPNGAISLGEEIFEVDPALCTECVGFSSEPQCIEACPPAACVLDPEHVESEAVLFDRAKQLHETERDSLTLGPATSHFRAG